VERTTRLLAINLPGIGSGNLKFPSARDSIKKLIDYYWMGYNWCNSYLLLSSNRSLRSLHPANCHGQRDMNFQANREPDDESSQVKRVTVTNAKLKFPERPASRTAMRIDPYKFMEEYPKNWKSLPRRRRIFCREEFAGN
jgi:hypothetical protein